MDILFITYTRIGDAVLSSGLLAYLLETYPGARPTIVAGPAAAGLFEAVPGLERLIPLAKRRFAGHWLRLWAATVGTRWDLVVDLRGSALAWCLNARVRRVLAPSKVPAHRVRQLGHVLGLEPPPAPRLWLTAEHWARADALLPKAGPPLLAVGPTANWGGKQWPADRFVALVRQLTAPGAILDGARLAVLGAASERAAADPLLRALPPDRVVDLVGKVDLLTAAACLARASLYVGNDSGLMHLAAAAGAPTLGLFGPSREALYAPWGERTAAVRTDRSFEEIVGHPAYDHRRQDSWMQSLSVEKVEAAAVALYRRAWAEAG